MNTQRQTSKEQDLASITEYISWCYDTNFRGFTDKVKQNNKSGLNSNTEINADTLRIQEFIKNETSPAVKKALKQALKEVDNTEEVLRKRWGNTLKLIAKSKAQVNKERKAREQAKEKAKA